MNLYNDFLNIANKYKENTCIYSDNAYSYTSIIQKVDILSSLLINSHNCLLAICIEKDENIIIAQLAANKAHKCFLPLDVENIYRNKIILNDSQPHWIFLKNDKDYNQYAIDNNFILIDSWNEKINLWKKDDYRKYENDCKYIIYSSGSTGTPKGIMLSDIPLINVVKQQANIFNINTKTRFSWLLSPAFDASLSDIYTTILSGGCIFIPKFKMHKIKQADHYFKLHNISHVDLSPSVIPLFYKIGFPESLKVVVFGGEIASEIIIKEIIKINKIKFFNAYGPTETTVCSSLCEVDTNWTANNIGKPLNGVYYNIVDNELHIGGKHLALGYLNKELNNKFYTENYMSWYKTGDLVKKDNNNYFYLGRIDNQFKYHGQLICPEEIENVCYQVGVESCVCIYDAINEKINLFYTGNIEINYLKNEISKRLANYMIPHFFYKEEKLEKNQNGKIDINKLRNKLRNKLK